MTFLKNPYRGAGMPGLWQAEAEWPSVDADAVAKLLRRCPDAAETPLHDAEKLASEAGVGALWLKDESSRMGLGSFKALGAAYVIARAAQERDLSGETYVAASAGNHGLSIAAGARVFGARAVILLAEAVPQVFEERLQAQGADVIRYGVEYEEGLEEAGRLAKANGWTLLSDSSWPGYTEIPTLVMEGYTQLAAETARQVPQAPTHIFLQAGVGGLAASAAAYFRAVWGDDPQIIVVEPEFARALQACIEAGAMVVAPGPISDMGRLDCKEASLVALTGLARDADVFMTVTEEQAAAAVKQLGDHGIGTSTSGGAGIAGLLCGAKELGITADARVLCVISEGPA